MAKKIGLGRGLAALLGEDPGQESSAGPDSQPRSVGEAGSVIEIPVSAVQRNPRQPRRVFDAEALDELATSIAAVGVVQPVIVRATEGGYELIAGERRWRAAQRAGFTVVPAIVRQASDTESLELALIENVVRQQLNPVDEAYALKVLLEDLGVTQENLAARVGKSRSAIANKMRLLDLPPAVQEYLAEGTLSEGHGRALLGLGQRGEQLRLARRAVDRGMSVRQVEDEVRRQGTEVKAKAGAARRDSRVDGGLDDELLDDVRDALFGLLGVMARVKGRGAGGVIEVPFKDEGELRRHVDRLRAQ
jgi:ParB family chromosome partitioning protein